jgi:hypothetical protein
MNEGELYTRSWGTSLRGRSMMETWKEGSFTGDSGGFVKEGSGDGHHFP